MNVEVLDQLIDRINSDLDVEADAEALWIEVKADPVFAEVSYAQYVDTYSSVAGW